MKYTNNNGQIIGELNGNTFRKVVKKSVHFMKVLNSWGMDKDLLNKLKMENVVEIYDKENEVTYHATVQQFKDKGIKQNHGHGEQYFLPLVNWTVENPKQTKLI